MALQVWLPLNGNVNNQGLSDLTFSIFSTHTRINDNGKIGKCYENISFTVGGLVSDKTIDLGQNQSMFCWFKINSLISSSSLGGGLVTQHDHTLNQGMGITIRYVSATTGYLSVSTGNGTSRTFNTYYGKTLLQAGVWYHGGYTYDGTTIRLYVNGALDGSFECSNMKVEPDYIHIYRWSLPTTSYSFNGCLNDVRIYDNVLSPREVKEISKGLVLHYPLAMPGGENLLKNGSLSTDFSNWSRNDASNMEIIEKDGCPAMHVSFSELKITRWITQNIISYIDTSNLDQIYTVSADVLAENITKGTTNPLMSPCYVSGSYDDNGTSKWLGGTYLDGAPYSYCYGITGKGWCHFVTRIKFAQVPTTMNFYCYFRDFTGDVWIRNLKFEIGDKATPWTPNPADPEYSIMGYDDPIEYDVSGYGNNGTKVGNITYNTDSPRYETSAYFNGSSDIRSAKSSFGWFDFNEGTVAAWYKPANTTQTWASVGVQHDGGAGSRSFSVCNYSGKAGTVVGYDSSWGYLASNCSMDANVWYHLCSTITNGDTVKLYVNGELVQTRTVTNTTGTIASTTQFAVGVDLPGSDERYTGQLSDVRFYATALSADDIKALYQIPASLSSDGTLFAGEYVEV